MNTPLHGICPHFFLFMSLNDAGGDSEGDAGGYAEDEDDAKDHPEAVAEGDAEGEPLRPTSEQKPTPEP